MAQRERPKALTSKGVLADASVFADQLTVHKRFEGLPTVSGKEVFSGLFNADGMWFRPSYRYFIISSQRRAEIMRLTINLNAVDMDGRQSPPLTPMEPHEVLLQATDFEIEVVVHKEDP